MMRKRKQCPFCAYFGFPVINGLIVPLYTIKLSYKWWNTSWPWLPYSTTSRRRKHGSAFCYSTWKSQRTILCFRRFQSPLCHLLRRRLWNGRTTSETQGKIIEMNLFQISSFRHKLEYTVPKFVLLFKQMEMKKLTFASQTLNIGEKESFFSE